MTREVFLDALAATIEQLCKQHEMSFVLPAREVARGTGALMRGMAVEWAIDPSPADTRLRGDACGVHAGYGAP